MPVQYFNVDRAAALTATYLMALYGTERWVDGGYGQSIYLNRSLIEQKHLSLPQLQQQVAAFLMDFEGILQDVKVMIGGGRVGVKVSSYLNTMTDFHSKHDVFTYLIHLGYLAYDEDTEECFIPNREVREQWILSVELSPDYKGLMELVNSSKQLVESTIECEASAVAEALNKSHEQICNNLNYNNEGTFQAVICLAYFYANLKYTIVKEMPAGKGVADVVMIPYVPNTPALIIELKRNSCEKTALTQIREKRYNAALEKYSGDLLFVGVNYDEKTKEHRCVIEKFVK